MLKYTRYKDTVGEFCDDGVYRIHLARTPRKRTAINGIEWDFWQTDSMWIAETCDGSIIIAEKTWTELENALKAFDPKNPRRDGIAFLSPNETETY